MPIEQLSPELERIVSGDQETEELGTGYDLAEGPVVVQGRRIPPFQRHSQ